MQTAPSPLTEATALRERVCADLDAQRKLLDDRTSALRDALSRCEAEQDPALSAYLDNPLPSLAGIRAEISEITERVQLASEALCQAGRRVDAARMQASRAHLAGQTAEISRLRAQCRKAAETMLAAHKAVVAWEASFVEAGLDSVGFTVANQIQFAPPGCPRFELADAITVWLKDN